LEKKVKQLKDKRIKYNAEGELMYFVRMARDHGSIVGQ
jgi:hypothetical protein